MDGKAVVCTVSLTADRPVDLDKFNSWIVELLQKEGERLYRAKGVLHMGGYSEQFVAQVVHMIFDGERGPLWPTTNKDAAIPNRNDNNDDEHNNNENYNNNNENNNNKIGNENYNDGGIKEKRSRLVFIGLNLNSQELQSQFMNCLV